MTHFLGIDIGSSFSKGVLLRGGEICASSVRRSGINYRETAERIREELLAEVEGDVKAAVEAAATGSGANNVPFAPERVSEMICTARGISRIFPAARTVIDVGGQSSRAMRIDAGGRIANFTVSEKCASGSARFIEVIANVLRIDLPEFGPISLRANNPISFSTGCAVFGESEAITRVAESVPREDIAAGVNKALAEKISSLARKIKLEEPCALCGGGALNQGLVRFLEASLKIRLLLPPQPQIVTALGAALMAKAAVEAEGRGTMIADQPPNE
jgi:(R)-2-hydroxyacyl-CoA dehydratese activating ATPase